MKNFTRFNSFFEKFLVPFSDITTYENKETKERVIFKSRHLKGVFGRRLENKNIDRFAICNNLICLFVIKCYTTILRKLSFIDQNAGHNRKIFLESTLLSSCISDFSLISLLCIGAFS